MSGCVSEWVDGGGWGLTLDPRVAVLEQRQSRAAGGNAGVAATAEDWPQGGRSAEPQDGHAELQGAARGEGELL